MKTTMKSQVIWIVATIISLFSFGCKPGVDKPTKEDYSDLSMDAQQMFSGVKSTLTDEEKNQVLLLSGLVANKETGKFQIEGEDAEVQLLPLDLNNDSKEEIFVVTYSMFLYGNTGQGFTLLMKNENNKYASVLSLPGIPELIYDGKSSMPAIQVGGPGFDFPVYVWNGNKYLLDKHYKTGNKITELEDVSRAYMKNIK
ncbi:MAG: hypothetical protein JSS90_07960 [Bacteroidetes bacterium]|jgi:hypothetical protein|nr:hypothetical protein [Bacteroidota bacterium]